MATCEFITTVDNVVFSTRTNGDKVVLLNLVLSKEQAVALTELVNSESGTELSVKIEETV